MPLLSRALSPVALLPVPDAGPPEQMSNGGSHALFIAGGYDIPGESWVVGDESIGVAARLALDSGDTVPPAFQRVRNLAWAVPKLIDLPLKLLDYLRGLKCHRLSGLPPQ